MIRTVIDAFLGSLSTPDTASGKNRSPASFVALEEGSDFAGIIRRYDVGRVVAFNEPWQFQSEAIWLATNPQQRDIVHNAAPRCLDEVFDVRHAMASIDAAIAL